MNVAKAFVPLAGEPILRHAVRGLIVSGCVDAVVVAAPSSEVRSAVDVLASLGGWISVVPGGLTRAESVHLAFRRAVELVRQVDVVLVHDAARALTPPVVFQDVAAAVRSGAPAVIPVLPVVDTVKQVDEQGRVVSTVDRSVLRSVQTPQGFAPEVLRRAHAAAAETLAAVTDDAGLVEAMGECVHTVPGHQMAFKITTAFDLMVAEAVLAR